MAFNEALALAAHVEQLEEKYDQVLGGSDTRCWRELLGYCVGKIITAGGDVPGVVGYLEELAALAAATGEVRPS